MFGVNGEEHVRTNAHVQIVAVPAPSSDEVHMPDGAALLSFVHPDGTDRMHEVTWWKRLDQGLFQPGFEMQVDVQARRQRDLRLPVLHATMRVRLTHNPQDTIRLIVGDASISSGWSYGVEFTGAVRTDI